MLFLVSLAKLLRREGTTELILSPTESHATWKHVFTFCHFLWERVCICFLSSGLFQAVSLHQNTGKNPQISIVHRSQPHRFTYLLWKLSIGTCFSDVISINVSISDHDNISFIRVLTEDSDNFSTSFSSSALTRSSSWLPKNTDN